MNCPLELKRAYKDGRLLPFVGAGVSISLEWKHDGIVMRGPSWSNLVEKASEILGVEKVELLRVRGTDLQILEYFKRVHSGQIAKLTNWLTKLMDPPDSAIHESKLHKALAELDRCKLFYTTNYDNFLEKSFSLHGRKTHVVAIESDMGNPIDDCEIVKFHGDLDHPDQIVLSESDYEKRLTLAAPLDSRLRADLLGRVVLFVGYSFRDPNVSYLFRLFTNHIANISGAHPGPRAFIFIADPSNFELSLFEERKIQVIPINGARMTEDIAEILEEMRG
jgi:SIR2-like domain